MISVTQMKSDSASTASGVDTCSDKINLQLHKLIVDLRDHPRLSKGVVYDNALKFSAQQRPLYMADLSEDLMACSASPTCGAHLCGLWYAAGRRNCMTNRKCVGLKLAYRVTFEFRVAMTM